MRASVAANGTIVPPANGKSDQRAARILARTLFKDMNTNGVPSEQILEVASELIGLVTAHIKDENQTRRVA